MSVSRQQGYANFNLYDIFANFLPGAVLVIGVFFPYVGVAGLFVGLKAGGLLFLLVLSFAAGLLVQALGGNVQSSGRDFANHIRKVDQQGDERSSETVDSEVESDINISTLDAYFIETFRAEFGLESDFTDWSRLHKLILAKLESTSRSRALRLQALYLAMRGMAVTMILLAVWFVLYMILAVADVFPSAVPVWTFPYLFCASLATAGVFYERGSEFSKDVAKYMVIEYYLEVIDQRERTVELDFLDEASRKTTGIRPNQDTADSRSGGRDGQFTAAKRELFDSITDATGDDERNVGTGPEDKEENGEERADASKDR